MSKIWHYFCQIMYFFFQVRWQPEDDMEDCSSKKYDHNGSNDVFFWPYKIAAGSLNNFPYHLHVANVPETEIDCYFFYNFSFDTIHMIASRPQRSYIAHHIHGLLYIWTELLYLTCPYEAALLILTELTPHVGSSAKKK